MSDNLRKDFSTKAGEALEPNSNKSTLDQAKEKITDTIDNLTGKAQGSEKGATQSVGDKVSSAVGK